MRRCPVRRRRPCSARPAASRSGRRARGPASPSPGDPGEAGGDQQDGPHPVPAALVDDVARRTPPARLTTASRPGGQPATPAGTAPPRWPGRGVAPRHRRRRTRRPETAQHGPAHRVLAAGRPDHATVVRGEHRAESGGGRGRCRSSATAAYRARLVQGTSTRSDEALAASPIGRPRSVSTRIMRPVLGEHVGDQPGDPAAQGDVGEALEQDGGQAVDPPGGATTAATSPGALVGREQLDRRRRAGRGPRAPSETAPLAGSSVRCTYSSRLVGWDRAEAQVAVVVVEFRCAVPGAPRRRRPEFPHHGRRAVGQQDPRRARRPRGSGTLRRSDGGLRGNGGRLFLETGHLMPSVAGAMSYPLRTAAPRP